MKCGRCSHQKALFLHSFLVVNVFFTEFIGSAILVGITMALGNDNNAPLGAGMNAFIVGVLITIVILALGYDTGGVCILHTI